MNQKVVAHHAYEEKGRTAAPALPHGTPNQKGVTLPLYPTLLIVLFKMTM